MLVVGVEGHGPRHLLRSRVDLDRATDLGDGGEQRTGDLANGPVGSQRHTTVVPARVLDDRLVSAQVERDDESARPVGRGEQRGLPSARGEA